MNVWEFAGLDAFYHRYAPRTPWGRRERDERPVFQDLDALSAELDAVGEALRFLKAFPERADEASEALGRLPLLPQISFSLDATALFLVKKFLVNARRAFRALSPEVRDFFRVAEPASELLSLLGSSDAESCEESFYVTEVYSEGLREARCEIRRLDAEMKQRLEARVSGILSSTGLDFRFRDFVVLPAERARALNLEMFSLEPCDASHYVIKPRLALEDIALAAHREALLARERQEEEAILARISAAVMARREEIFGLAASLTRFDVALAKARLALEHGMTRPHLRAPRRPSDGFFDLDAPPKSELPIVMEKGRLLPLEWECVSSGLRYWPLTLTLDTHANVLLGSNMGGKTVALRTLAFLQHLAHMGFYVPAERFESCFFAQITCVVPEAAHESGLSSFGLEIVEFSEAWNHRRLPALFLVDEFARTTNSREATALLAALLRRISECPGAVALVSTHFMELRPDFCDLACFRMRGLNASLFRAAYERHAGGTLTERLRHLSECMEYEIVREAGVARVQDALHVAGALGLDESILNYAKAYLEETYAGKTGTQP